jgi:hypothetical protein
MVIESDAWRFINDAIESEKNLFEIENKEKAKGKIMIGTSLQFQMEWDKLVQKFCKINSIANSKGKGRDDLSIEILKHAEHICRTISAT